MDGLIKSFRLGVVQIFGLVVPGFVIMAALAYPLHLADHLEIGKLLVAWQSYRIEFVVALLTLAYILGFVVRLIPMDWFDAVCRVWMKVRVWFRLRYFGKYYKQPTGKDGCARLIALKGSYPYRNLKNALDSDGLQPLSTYVKWDESSQPSRSLINALKLVVANESPISAGRVTSIEANIRMMFGIFVGGSVGLVGLWIYGPPGSWRFLVAIGCVLCSILHTFTQTRYSELVALLTAVTVCAGKSDSGVHGLIRSGDEVIAKQPEGGQNSRPRGDDGPEQRPGLEQVLPALTAAAPPTPG